MRIEDFRSEINRGRARVSATVMYEDCDRPAQELYFETDEAFADGLTCNPNAFLVAAIMPALHHGEERVFVDAEVCPELRDGLMTAMTWVRHWHYDAERKNVRIEAGTQSRVPASHRPERAGQFFSGGIDSLATLRANRLNYPLEHPGSIKDVLLVYGQNSESDDRLTTFEQARRSLSEFAQDAGVTLIPVYANVRSLYDDTKFFLHYFQGAALAAVAHAFTRRLVTVTIASSMDIPNMYPYGTHPLLDSNYSSVDLKIRHDGITLSRQNKARLVAGWDEALHIIKVCTRNWPGSNCGKCEKCLRTMLALLALGSLEQSTAFPRVELTQKLINSNIRINNQTFFDYEELTAPLAEKGRDDLARAIDQELARFYSRSRKRKIKKFGRKYLRSNFDQFKRLNLF